MKYLAALSAFVFGTTVLAQTAPAPSAAATAIETVKLEAFNVTGTNIKRASSETVLPVTIVGADTISAIDAPTPIELIATLPQATSVPSTEAGFGGLAARGDVNTVALRGFKSGNTLILINGRRMAPGAFPSVASDEGVPGLSVNVSQLPNRGLGRIEVLRDGASAVYGTDAVAGVVNYIMARNFRGTEVALRYGLTEFGDGVQSRATITHGRGFANGKGWLLTTVDYLDRKIIYTGDRPWSATSDMTSRVPAPFNDINQNLSFFKSSAQGFYGMFTLGQLGTDGVTFVAGRPTGVPATLASAAGAVFIVPTGGGSVGFKTTTPNRTGPEKEWYFDQSRTRTFSPGSKRLSWFTQAEYKLLPSVTAFADFSFYRAASNAVQEEQNVLLTADGAYYAPATNYWNPFGVRFFDPQGRPNADGTPRLVGTPAAVRIDNRRLLDGGIRPFEVTDTAVRGVAGLRGNLANTWTWETAGVYSATRAEDFTYNMYRKSLFQQSLNRTDNQSYNPFGRTFAVQNNTIVVTGAFTNPEGVLAPMRDVFRRFGKTFLLSGDFRASGELFRLWRGNSVAGAFGGETRRETYDDTRPPFAGPNPPNSGLDPTLNDFFNFSTNPDLHVKRSVTAAYAEIAVPFVGERNRLPLVQALELTASARWEKYDSFGSTIKPKVGLNWTLLPSLKVRGSYNEGFRAPSLPLMFTQTIRRASTGNDPYRGPVTNLVSDGFNIRTTIVTGNPSLQPEESKGKSAGIVLDVPRVKGLSLTIDYWEIKQSGVIAASGSVNDDVTALAKATQAAIASGTPVGQIDLGSGTANYQGDPAMLRLPVTQQDRDLFAAYNAGKPASQQLAAVGPINHQLSTYFNQAELFSNGLDLELNYATRETALGRFAFNTSWTYLIDLHAFDKPGSPRRELRALNGTALWRGSNTLTWRRGNWEASIASFIHRKV
ncbi:MAG: TonB-dependent receptor [Verrucomicrobia bacterium]|nr:TonB-dependent receptor [Verrucomicrobiota bacterium]